MRTFFADLTVQLKGIWARLDGGQRLVVLAVLAAAGVGLGAIFWFAGRPSYEEIYTARDGEDLKEIRRLLGQAAVPFVTDDQGQSILVERSRVAQANAVLFEGGLRSTGARNVAPGVSSLIEDSETKAFRLDAATRAQTEAAILELDGVVQATVTASRPKRSPFRDRDAETRPRATVALRLRTGTPFEAVAKNAASLASSQLAVPMQNVDIVNASTHERWSWDPDRDAGTGSSEFLAQQRSLSAARTAKAQEALDAVYPGKTVVTVNVELDPEWEITSQKVLPPEPLVKSEKSTKDSTENGVAPTSAGDPSSASNATEATTQPGQRSVTKKETRDREYVTEIGEKRAGRLAPPIRRLSVALLYDQALAQQAGFAEDQLVQTVKAIVGWDKSRDPDDAFSTLAGEFAAVEPAAVVAGPGFGETALRWAPVAGQVLGVLLVLVFLRGLFKRRTPASAAAQDVAETEIEPGPEEQARRMRREIERQIAADPAALAKLLESWLSEQKV